MLVAVAFFTQALNVPGTSFRAVLTADRTVFTKDRLGRERGFVRLPDVRGGGVALDDFNSRIKLFVGSRSFVVREGYGEMAGGLRPSGADTYRVGVEGTIRHTGFVPSNDEPGVRDLNGDGHLEILSYYQIGNMYHAAMPWWWDVYTVASGKPAKANSQFPKIFRPLVSDLWEVLLKFPDDVKIWAYYGYARKLAKKSGEPKASFERMIRALRVKGRNTTTIPALRSLAEANKWPAIPAPRIMVKPSRSSQRVHLEPNPAQFNDES